MKTVPQLHLLTRLRLDLRRHGLHHTFYLLVIKVINKFVPIRIFRTLSLHRINQTNLTCPDGYTSGFLSESQLRRYAMDPRNDMDSDFLDEALAKGDRCYAMLKDNQLAAYNWYSLQPTRIHPPELVVEFDPQYVYSYKAMTLPEHRGLRLAPISAAQALQWYQQCGKKGLVSYVESHNFDSLKPGQRLGYRIFGSIFMLRLPGRYAIFSTPACRRFGFQLKQLPPCPEALEANKA